MQRIVEQMNAAELDQKSAEFRKRRDEVLAAVTAHDLRALLALTGPLALKELGDAGIRSYYLEKVFPLLPSGVTVTASGPPKKITDEVGNVGFSYHFVATDMQSRARPFMFAIVSYAKKGILIRTMVAG